MHKHIQQEQDKVWLKIEAYESDLKHIKFKTHLRNCVQDALQAKGYRETQKDDWDIIWVD